MRDKSRKFWPNSLTNMKRLYGLIDLYERGMSKAGIGREFGADHTTIIFWVRKLNLNRESNPLKEQLRQKIIERERPVYNPRKKYYIPTKKSIDPYDYDGEKINMGKSYKDYLKSKGLELHTYLHTKYAKHVDR